jgi:RNA polymerase sigma-70 factor (ECF subfamily)
MSPPPDSRADSLFPATSWTAIRNAQDPSAPEYARNLERLIELYWRPVYWVIRRAWRRSAEEAADLTQEFFTRHVVARSLVRGVSPDRGSFRSLLRVAVRNFMLTAARDAARVKRGGDLEIRMVDPGVLEELEAVDLEGASPEAMFDAAWNRTVLARGLELMRTRLLSDGRTTHLAVFQRYELDEDGARPSYADVGAALGLSVPQVKHALIETRVLYKEAVTDVVREYVDSPEDLEEELRSLFGR